MNKDERKATGFAKAPGGFLIVITLFYGEFQCFLFIPGGLSATEAVI